MATVLIDDTEETVATENGLRVSASDAARLTGWELKPEGMCRGEVCVPLPAGVAKGDRIDLAGFWRHLGRPVAQDTAGKVFVLGAGSDQRNTALAEAEAPDFTLPDLAGKPHALSELRGNKVFLCTWASW